MARLFARSLSGDELPRWKGLVEASPQASVYHTTEYLEALCSAAGGCFRVVGVFRGDTIVAGVALYERTRGSDTWVSPRLLLYYNGILLPPTETSYPSLRTAHETAALGALEEVLGANRYASINLRNHGSVSDVRVFLSRGWQATPSYSYVVDLRDPLALQSRMEHNLRRLIKRCSDGSFTLTEDDDFEAFFRLHCESLARHRQAPYLPRASFEAFFRQLRSLGLCALFHARRADRTVVASQLVLLGPRGTSHTVAAATHAEHLRSGVTAWLRLRVFEALAAAGRLENDLTDASLNPATHFKSQLGGDLRMSLVLQSPESVAWRARRWAGSTLDRARAAAGRLRRHLGREDA